MTIGYRALLRLSGDTDAIRIAESELHGWLAEKVGVGTLDRVRWDDTGHHQLGTSTDLSITHFDTEKDSARRRKYVFRESTNNGNFEVATYAVSRTLRRNEANIIVVETSKLGVERDEALYQVDPPRLVRKILGSTSAFDGVTPVLPESSLVHEQAIDDLLQYITDPDRSISVVVAVSLDPRLDSRWRTIINNLTRKSVGVASSFVVTAAASERLNNLLPPSHQVKPGQVRTFLPHADLEDIQDGLRHRVLGPATLARAISGQRVKGHLPNVHAEMALRRFVESGLPADVRRHTYLLDEADSTARIGAEVSQRAQVDAPITVEAVPSTEHDSVTQTHETRLAATFFQGLKSIVTKWLGITHVQPEHVPQLDRFIAEKDAQAQVLGKELESIKKSRDELESQIESLHHELDDKEIQLGIQTELALEAGVSNFELTELLRSNNIFETQLASEVDWSAPASLEEIATMLSPGGTAVDDNHPALEFVEFTGELKPLLQIMTRDETGRLAMVAWGYVRTLYDYARLSQSGEFDGSFRQYMNGDCAGGYRSGSGRYAAKESETVSNNPKMRNQRVFSVPNTIAPAGTQYMEEHFRLETRNSVAPRMYFYDATKIDGRIYIGYIGKHLDNTKTN